MVRLGTLVAYALLGSFVVLGPLNAAAVAIPGHPPLQTPTVPNLPAPPATVGRCLQVSQAFLNSGSSSGEALRNAGLLAVDHQEDEAMGYLNDSSTQLDGSLSNLVPFYTGVLTTTNEAATAMNQASAAMTTVIGPALNRSLNSGAGIAIEWIPATAGLASVAAPWFGRYYNDTVLMPLRDWNRETAPSDLLKLQNQWNFFLAYSLNVVANSNPPLGPVNTALSNNVRDVNAVLSSPGGVGDATTAYANGMTAASLGAAEGYAGAAGLLVQDNGGADPVQAAQVRLAAMGSAAVTDADMLGGTASARLTALRSASADFAANAPGCVRN